MTTMRRSNDDAARAVDEAVAHAVARRTRMLSARVAAAESSLSALRERVRALAEEFDRRSGWAQALKRTTKPRILKKCADDLRALVEGRAVDDGEGTR